MWRLHGLTPPRCGTAERGGEAVDLGLLSLDQLPYLLGGGEEALPVRVRRSGRGRAREDERIEVRQRIDRRRPSRLEA
jgi:hypothetical protein